MDRSRTGENSSFIAEVNRLLLTILSQEEGGNGKISVFIGRSKESVFYSGYLSKIYGFYDLRVVGELLQDKGFKLPQIDDASRAGLHQVGVHPDKARSKETIRRTYLFLKSDQWDRNMLFVRNPKNLYRLEFAKLAGINWLVNNGVNRKDINKFIPPSLQARPVFASRIEERKDGEESEFDPLVIIPTYPKYLRKIGECFRRSSLVPNYQLAQCTEPTVKTGQLIGKIGEKTRRRRLNKNDYKRDKRKFDKRIKRALDKLTKIYQKYGYRFRFGAFGSEVIASAGYSLFSLRIRNPK